MSRAEFLLFFIALLTPFSSVFAFAPLEIIINEIAWMGTENSSTDEWIELYNNSNFSCKLLGK